MYREFSWTITVGFEWPWKVKVKVIQTFKAFKTFRPSRPSRSRLGHMSLLKIYMRNPSASLDWSILHLRRSRKLMCFFFAEEGGSGAIPTRHFPLKKNIWWLLYDIRSQHLYCFPPPRLLERAVFWSMLRLSALYPSMQCKARLVSAASE